MYLYLLLTFLLNLLTPTTANKDSYAPEQCGRGTLYQSKTLEGWLYVNGCRETPSALKHVWVNKGCECQFYRYIDTR